MNRNFLKSTTALALTLSLLQPAGVMAQEAVTLLCTPQLILDRVACLDPETKLLFVPPEDQDKGKKPEKSDKDTESEASEGAKADTEAAKREKAAAAALADAARAAAEAAAADADATAKAADAARAEADAAAIAAEQKAAAAAEAAAIAAAKAETDAATEESEKAAAEAEAAAAAAAAAEAERARAADESAAAAAAASDVAAGKAARAAEKAQAGAEAAAAVEAAAAAQASAAAAAESAAAAAAAAAATAKGEKSDLAPLAAQPLCDPLRPDMGCADSEISPDAPQASVPDVPTVAPPTEAARAPVAEAPGANVVTREVTTDNHRASTEEFDNEVSAAPQADSGGLTDLEKAGLLLLGAVVVGAILNNNERVVANTGDRVVVQDQDGGFRVYKDDDALLMQPGATVRTETFSDGSTRSFVTRADGTQIVTIRDAEGRVQRRVHIDVNGFETTLIDDTRAVEVVDLRTLPQPDPRLFAYDDAASDDALRSALLAADQRQIDRTFSLRQIRDIRPVRELALEISLEAITFETGSAAIAPAQAERLSQLGNLMADLVAQDPSEVFLIEGHTDAIGEPAYNLALSDRRAETVALALAEYFAVPPENMVVQGYGEQFLKLRTLDAARENRRVAVRRITALLN